MENLDPKYFNPTMWKLFMGKDRKMVDEISDFSELDKCDSDITKKLDSDKNCIKT